MTNTIQEKSVVKVNHKETSIGRVIEIYRNGFAEVELVGVSPYTSQTHKISNLKPLIEDEQDFTEVANRIALHEIMRHFRFDVQVGEEEWDTKEMAKNLFNEVVEYEEIDVFVVSASLDALSDYSEANNWEDSYSNVLENMRDEYLSATGMAY